MNMPYKSNEINIPNSYLGVFSFRNEDVLSLKHPSKFGRSITDSRYLLEFDLHNSDDSIFSFSEFDQVSVLFCGEIFNIDSLTKLAGTNDFHDENVSFSNLCCLLFRKLGQDFAKHINGMFSIIVRDEKNNRLLLIADRFGSARPIYYCISDRIVFSSHLKKLAFSGGHNFDIDRKSMALFLKYAYIPSPSTIFKGIKRLKAGEMLVYDGRHCNLRRYVDFSVKKCNYTEDEATEIYHTLLANSISRRLDKRGNQHIGLFLSGGLDSSANVAIAKNQKKCLFQTFGVGFDNPEIDERPFARIVANHYDVPFHDYVFTGDEIEDLPKILWHLEQPFLENGLLLTYAGFKSVNGKADIILSGNCADQLFGTGGFAGSKPIALRLLFEKFNLLPLLKISQKLMRSPLFYEDNIFYKMNVLFRRVTDFNNWFFWGFDDHELKHLCAFDTDSIDFNIFSNTVKSYSGSLEDYYNFSIIHQDIEHYACENVLVKSYRIAEMFGIVERDPYLDHNVVDFLLGLKLNFKRAGSLLDYLNNTTRSKNLHRLTMKSILPERILNKPKQGGFVNMASCLKDGGRKNLIFNYILKSDFLKDHLEMNNVRGLLSDYNDLSYKQTNWIPHRDAVAGKILCLLTLTLWNDLFKNGSFNNQPNLTLTEMIS